MLAALTHTQFYDSVSCPAQNMFIQYISLWHFREISVIEWCQNIEQNIEQNIMSEYRKEERRNVSDSKIYSLFQR